jgi:transposase-like protein/IS1 family transposase
MKCRDCQIEATKRGKDRKGNQRWKCGQCGKGFTEPCEKPLGRMILDFDRALKAIQLLCEGCSVRTTERVTEINLRTLLKLLVIVGEKCERFLEDRIQNVAVRDVQADEIWAFVKMKEKEKVRRDIEDDRLGDAYTFVGIERHSKLVLCWHLGRRSYDDTFAFTEKLYRATGTHWQLTTDGFKAYQNAVIHSLGARDVDFAQLVKVYAHPSADDHTYSPPTVINSVPVEIYGNPDPDRICTSHVERSNLTMRMQMRRFTRLTNGFNKKRENLKAMLALYFAYYNFCRVHSTIRVTPAMEAGLTDHIWELSELVGAAA